MKITTALVAALGFAASANAQQTAAPAKTVFVDKGRLVAAQALIDELMPPATREQMLQGMVAPMLANMQRGMTDNPQFATLMNKDPRVKAIMDRFMARQFARTTEMMQASLPGMIAAMTSAYARRFDVAQLAEIRAFFQTQTGRAYMQASMTIMADPDVAAWQRTMMSDTMRHVQAEATEVGREIAALYPDKTK